MGELIKAAPLVEALCEFRFAVLADSDADIALPGQLFERLKHEFSESSQFMKADFEIKFSGVGQPEITSSQREGPLLRLARSDKSAFVQVGANLLTVNVTKPYPGWVTFREIIVRVFSEYIQLRDTQFRLDRVGLRYINHLLPPENVFEIGNLIMLIPDFLGPLDRPLSGFYQRYDILHEELGSTLIHRTAVIEREKAEIALALDLDFSSQNVDSFNEVSQLEHWLNQAHDQISLAFRASLVPTYLESLKK